ncbi:hypothetical protein HWV62_38632 [Athelia sp. TMB]|nr:hypothetical protein HWV62_38632 [Athelia sp. TMB]
MAVISRPQALRGAYLESNAVLVKKSRKAAHRRPQIYRKHPAVAAICTISRPTTHSRRMHSVTKRFANLSLDSSMMWDASYLSEVVQKVHIFATKPPFVPNLFQISDWPGVQMICADESMDFSDYETIYGEEFRSLNDDMLFGFRDDSKMLVDSATLNNTPSCKCLYSTEFQIAVDFTVFPTYCKDVRMNVDAVDWEGSTLIMDESQHEYKEVDFTSTSEYTLVDDIPMLLDFPSLMSQPDSESARNHDVLSSLQVTLQIEHELVELETPLAATEHTEFPPISTPVPGSSDVGSEDSDDYVGDLELDHRLQEAAKNKTCNAKLELANSYYQSYYRSDKAEGRKMIRERREVKPYHVRHFKRGNRYVDTDPFRGSECPEAIVNFQCTGAPESPNAQCGAFYDAPQAEADVESAAEILPTQTLGEEQAVGPANAVHPNEADVEATAGSTPNVMLGETDGSQELPSMVQTYMATGMTRREAVAQIQMDIFGDVEYIRQEDEAEEEEEQDKEEAQDEGEAQGDKEAEDEEGD